MTFTLNKTFWTVEEILHEDLLAMYRQQDEDASAVFGFCDYQLHKIYITKEMEESQKVQTLRHELAHCWLWTFGYGSISDFTEELVCDIVSACSNFVETTSTEYWRILESEKV